MFYKDFRISVTGLVALVSLASSCVVDDDYRISDIKDVNTEMTLFSGGLEVPVGSTSEFRLDSLLKTFGGKDLDNLLKQDLSGNYSLAYDGSYDLDKTIEDMGLSNIGNVDGVSVQNEINVKIVDIDPQSLKINGIDVSTEMPVGTIDLESIKVPAIDKSGDVAFSIEDCLPDGGKLDDVQGSLDGYSFALMSPADEVTVPGYGSITIASVVGILSGGDSSASIDCQSILSANNLDSVTCPQSVNSVSIGADLKIQTGDISSVSNFKLKQGSRLKVDLEVVNPMFLTGVVTPQITLDVSSILKMAGLSAIDLSEVTIDLSKSNKASKEYEIAGLADGQPSVSGKRLSAGGDVVLGGAIAISGASTSYAKILEVGDGSMSLNVKVSFVDIVAESMDVTLGQPIEYVTDVMELPLDMLAPLPSEVKSVDKVVLDSTKPVSVTISSPALKNVTTSDGSAHLDVNLTAVVKFPAGVTIENPDNGTTDRITITGNLFNGEIRRDIVIKDIKPSCSGSTLNFNGKVKVDVSAKATGSFSTAKVSKDTRVRTLVSGEPAITDFNIELNTDVLKDKLTISQEKELSFDLSGADDFGTFSIMPEAETALSMEIALPALEEIAFVADDVKVKLPDVVVVDKDKMSGLPYSVDASNTIILNGEIPAKVTVPVKSLHVTPVKGQDGKLVVNDKFSIKGAVALSGNRITKKTITALSGKSVSVKASMPDINIKSISLDGDFNKSVSEKFNFCVLDQKAVDDIPEAVKYIKDVQLDGTKLHIDLSVEGLPLSAGSQFILKDAEVSLPEFIRMADGSSSVKIPDTPIVEGKPVVFETTIAGLRALDLSRRQPISGDVSISALLHTEKPDVDFAKLASSVLVRVNAVIGNGSSAQAPGSIVISKITGNAEYPVSQTVSVKLDGIPQVLKDVELRLNPTMALDISTNLSIPMDASITLVPYLEGKAVEDNTVTVKGITLPYSGSAAVQSIKTYRIGRDVSAGEGWTAVRTDLSPVVRHIPDSIQIRINADVEIARDCIIEPSAKYSCNMDYSLDVPLCFENEPRISFTLDDIAISEQIAKYFKMGKVALKGTFVSTLPVGASASVLLLDANDRELPLVENFSVDISPSPDGTTPSRKEIKPLFGLKEPDGAVPAKMRVGITVAPVRNVQLRGDEYIKAERLLLVLPEGVTADPQNL